MNQNVKYHRQPVCGNRSAVGIFLGALFFALPLAWGKILNIRVPLFGEVTGTDFAVLAVLALGVIIAGSAELYLLTQRDSGCRWFLAAAGIGGVVVCLQQAGFGWNPRLFLNGLFYFAVPAAGLLLAREIRRWLPLFLLVLFCGSLGISLREWTAGLPAHGLAGNWNWNWTLLAISAPSLAFFLPSRMRLAAGTVLALGVIFGQFAITPDFSSRGTLAGGLGAIILLLLTTLLHRKRKWRKWILPMAAILIVAVTIPLYFGICGETIPTHIPEKIRLTLWQGAISLGESNWRLGVEPGRFEGEIAPHLPVAYSDSDLAADRHPHPHNELLFYWCGFGVFGVVWWIFTVVLGIRGMIRRRKGDELVLLAAWCWTVLLIHGQVDVILGTPLAGGLFALLTGTLAAVGIPQGRRSGFRGWQMAVHGIFGVAAAILFCMNLSSGWNCREGKLALLNHDPRPARESLTRSAAILPTPENLYTLGSVELFDFRNPSAAAKTFARITSECRFPSYSHSAGRLARSLAASGKPKAALPFFEAEQRNFPRSAVNLRLWESTVRALGDAAAADVLLAQWKELMEHKGIPPQLFPYLLRNQRLDDSPADLKSFLKDHRR